jgi:hypothetical protein
MTRNQILRFLFSTSCILVVLAMTASPVFALSGGPDSFGYYFSDSTEPGGPTFNFEDISTTGTSLTLSDDQTSSAIPLSFSFEFYGVSYTDVYISSNGFLTFLSDQPAIYNAIAIPNTAAPNGMVAGWWADLDPRAGGSIKYQVLGNAPTRRFIVQYTEVPHFDWGPNDLKPVTFQIKLFESTNGIEVHYVTAQAYNNRQESAGIENQNGTTGLQYFLGRGSLSTPVAVRYVYGTPPVAVDDAGTGFVTDEDIPLDFDVADNDTDADGNLDPTTTNTNCPACSLPNNGSLANHGDGTFTYTPNMDYAGSDGFVYEICDTTGQCDTATVSLVVNPINDAPVADAQSLTTDEDTPLTVTLTGSDVDGDSLTFTVVTQPAHGSLTGTAPDLTYTPDPDFNGADSFTFIVNDGELDSAVANIDITINAVNDAPTADAQSLTTDEDTPLAVTLTGSDVDGDSLTFTVVTPPAFGSLTGTAPDLTYTPDPDFNGADSFTFIVNDGELESAVANIDITINAVNDAPTADDQDLQTDEDTPPDGHPDRLGCGRRQL